MTEVFCCRGSRSRTVVALKKQKFVALLGLLGRILCSLWIPLAGWACPLACLLCSKVPSCFLCVLLVRWSCPSSVLARSWKDGSSSRTEDFSLKQKNYASQIPTTEGFLVQALIYLSYWIDNIIISLNSCVISTYILDCVIGSEFRLILVF